MSPLFSVAIASVPLRAVLFDLWGTLVLDPRERSAPRQAWRSANVHRILAECGSACAIDTVNEALIALIRGLNALQDEGKDPGALARVDLFFDLLRDPSTAGLDATQREAVLNAIAGLERELAPELAPGAVETLAAVKAADLKTALVSNTGVTTAPALRWLLEEYGLRAHLDLLVFSDELALAKPDPAIFRHTLEALGVDAAEAAFVGDAPHNDISGAQAAGLFAVQIGDKTRDGVIPGAQIDRLDELMDVLAARGLLESAAPVQR
jgi:HAD superfamily hydrolase (TIGR01509 family)